MNCDRIEELLSPYLEGELGADDSRLVEEHVKACPDCRRLLAALTETREVLSGFPELEISESLRTRLQAIPGKKKRFSFSLDFLLKPSLQPVFATAAVFMTLVSFYLFGPYKTAIDRTIDRKVHQGYSRVEKLYVKAGSFRDSLEARKDNLLVSIKNLEILGGSKDQTQQ
jgi:Putative zinc-finger